jgi:hypothetical protein
VELGRKQRANGKLRLDRYERWDIDQGAGTLRLSTDAGRAVVAPVQIVGTIDLASGTWLWAWANRSIARPLVAHAAAVREHGRAHGLKPLTERKWEATEDDGWRMTALAVKLSGAAGAYRVRAGGGVLFMTVGPWRRLRSGERASETGAFACRHVFAGTRPVLLVSREGGDWQLLCGAVHGRGERPRLAGLEHFLERDPSLRVIEELPPEWWAERSGVGKRWRRRKISR